MRNIEELEEALSRPTEADIKAAKDLDGELLVLGASGKMGPTFVRLARRAAEAGGGELRIWAVARYGAPGSQAMVEDAGAEAIPCDLLDGEAVRELPDCRNVVYMVGQKFGTADDEPRTWAINSAAPAIAASRFKDSRIVAFSTGNVYPLTSINSKGPSETAATGPVGEYAWSALARERIFNHYSDRHQTPMAILRLNYAIDLRYGVLRDIANKVYRRRPIDLAMGHVNVIWQRDANSVALRSFQHCSTPPFVLNLTGAETVSVRDVALRFGRIFEIDPVLEGSEQPTALLSDASRCHEMFDPETASLEWMIDQTAEWVRSGGESLGKPTHFEQRGGRF